MAKKRKYFWFGLLLICLLWPSFTAAQEPIEVLDEWVETSFRDHIAFYITVEGENPIVEASLLYRVRSTGLVPTSRGDAELEPGNRVEVSYTIDQEEEYFPPGSEFEYWWKITDETGDVLKTEPKSLLYLDDHHNWNNLSNDRLELYWYMGDEAFGEQVYERANHTLDQIETDAGVRVELPVKIFLYGSHADLMDAIDVGAQEWTGGMAFTEQGVVVLGASPRDIDFVLVATPHELTHLVIHQATANPYGGLPTWLDEGLAVYMSGEIDADWRGYRELVTRRAEENELISLQTLSSNFPADPDLAGQSYAQSGLVVEFIIDHYGSQALADLLEVFSEGSTYDDALLEVLGVDTWGLDNAWRESIGAPRVDVATGNEQVSDPEAEEILEAPSPEPTPVPVVEEPSPIEETAPDTGGMALPCIGSSLVGLAVIAAFVVIRVR